MQRYTAVMPEQSKPDASIPAVVLPSWVKAATRCGFNLKPILQQHGIELDLLHLEDSTVSAAVLDRVLETCVQRARDAHFPFVMGEIFAFEYMPDLETYLTTSSSLRDAARVLDWIPALVDPTIDARIEESGDIGRLVLHLPATGPPRTRPYHAEAFFASIFKFLRALVEEPVGFRELRFRHPAPPHYERYEPFFRVPVQFGQPRNELVFDRHALDRPLEGEFPALNRQARQLVEERVARLTRREPLSIRVARALAARPALLQGSITDTAAAFATGERTLQRRLRDEGASFADIQDQVRYRRAVELLGDENLDLEAISELLGFSDRRSFTRAFRRWTGSSPSAYRQRLRETASA